MDRNLLLLGIAKKAGLLAVGADDTYSSARTGKARLIISASDSSESAYRRAAHSGAVCNAVHIASPYTSFELGGVSGRGSPGTLAILDTGLAMRFVGGLAEAQPGLYGRQAEEMELRMRNAVNSKRQSQSGDRRTAR